MTAKPTPSLAAPHDLPDMARQLRAFNRDYTRRIGVLGANASAGPQLTLTETRVLWELAQRPGMTASALVQELGLDAGYLSRLLARLQRQGLLKSTRSVADARHKLLRLTASGQRAYAALDRRAQAQAQSLLAALPAAQQQELLYAASRMRLLLASDATPSEPQLRALRPGDLGWVVSRHGALYHAEYGWDQRFEGLVAEIAAHYLQQLQPLRESAWVAELNGHAVGCAFLVQARDESNGQPLPGVAQLRMLLVEPAARGHGIGKLLVQTCHRFAAQAGYRHVRLWTNSLLLAARGIYGAAGYQLISSQAHHSFGHDLVGEVWELQLPEQLVLDED